ncbi:MAG TPA: SDR family NAD(P)-dependent oxidoreductase, partial [Hellea balneolensis]|nr:SDR family NAD(P)-dependent oxidoreductase [Hellea balneolensis]
MRNKQIYRGKICVVTGAASGIGRALSLALQDAGAILAISDINQEGLGITAERLGGKTSNSLLVDTLDIADASDIESYAPHVKRALGPADYLFNVA